MTLFGVELVVRDGHALGLVRGVEPDISDFTAVGEHVVAHRQVVGTNLVGLVTPVVRGPLGHDTNATVNEVVAVDDVAIATVHDDTDVAVVDGVVERRVALVVNEGVVGQLEEVQLVAVVPSVAHCTVHGGNTGNGGVVHVNVQRVVAVSDGEPLRRAAAGDCDSGHRSIVHVEGGFTTVVRIHSVVAFEVVGRCGDPRAAVPVVLSGLQVHEW